MTDAFVRPSTRVKQSARPKLVPAPLSIQSSDAPKRLRQNSGSTDQILRAAMAALSSSHSSEIKSLLRAVAAAVTSRRNSVTAQIGAEYDYKITAALMTAPASQHAAILAVLVLQKSEALKAATRAVSTEGQGVRQAATATIKDRQQAERKSLQQRRNPRSYDGMIASLAVFLYICSLFTI